MVFLIKRKRAAKTLHKAKQAPPILGVPFGTRLLASLLSLHFIEGKPGVVAEVSLFFDATSEEETMRLRRMYEPRETAAKSKR